MWTRTIYRRKLILLICEDYYGYYSCLKVWDQSASILASKTPKLCDHLVRINVWLNNYTVQRVLSYLHIYDNWGCNVRSLRTLDFWCIVERWLLLLRPLVSLTYCFEHTWLLIRWMQLSVRKDCYFYFVGVTHHGISKCCACTNFALYKEHTVFLSSWTGYYWLILCIGKGFPCLCGYLINCLLYCVSFVASNTKIGSQHLVLFFWEQIIQIWIVYFKEHLLRYGGLQPDGFC